MRLDRRVLVEEVFDDGRAADVGGGIERQAQGDRLGLFRDHVETDRAACRRGGNHGVHTRLARNRRAGIDQHLNELDIPFGRGERQRRIAAVEVHARARVQQPLDDRRLAAHGSHVQRRPAVFRSDVDVRTLGEQQLRLRRIRCGENQRRQAGVATRVRVGALLEESRQIAGTAVQGGEHQRCLSAFTCEVDELAVSQTSRDCSPVAFAKRLAELCDARVDRARRLRRFGPGHALVDPSLDHVDLLWLQRASWRHLRPVFLAGDAPDQPAPRAIAGDDYDTVEAAEHRMTTFIEPQPRLRLCARVAAEALLAKDRLHVAVVIDRRLRRGDCRAEQDSDDKTMNGCAHGRDCNRRDSIAKMNSRRFLPALLLLFVGSGCAALIYEIVWFQLLELVDRLVGGLARRAARHVHGRHVPRQPAAAAVHLARGSIRCASTRCSSSASASSACSCCSAMPLRRRRLHARGPARHARASSCAASSAGDLPAAADAADGRDAAGDRALGRDDAGRRVVARLLLRRQHRRRGGRLPARRLLPAARLRHGDRDATSRSRINVVVAAARAR